MRIWAKATAIAAFAVVMLVAAAGCTAFRAPVVPPFASGFNYWSAPMNLQFRSTELGSKTGRASATNVLGLFTFGDSGIAAAARDGNIKTINHADTEFLSVIGALFVRQTTIVYGD
ncbi:MAG: TRL domain-containing protein [Candidatus Brocadiaceae bacterium]|jgi:hypothetical protein